ncbi:MAG: stage II sporulation protein R [Clostridiales bacterium]|nr:stage II sporulation protein R [Clostridiales bacterium]
MKKIVFAVLALVALVAVIAVVPSQKTNADFLRIHIRADSNDSADQGVKYQVKNAVVDFLTPYLCKATTKQKAMSIVKSHLGDIEAVCDKVLLQNGFSYKSHAKLTQEQFPDRAYGDVTLAAGVYDALIIELGSGSGNNWWCVVYPPLCFVGGESNGTNQIIYKSKLQQIINDWKSAR